MELINGWKLLQNNKHTQLTGQTGKITKIGEKERTSPQLLRRGFYELGVWILLTNDIDKISFIIKSTQHQIAAT